MTSPVAPAKPVTKSDIVAANPVKSGNPANTNAPTAPVTPETVKPELAASFITSGGFMLPADLTEETAPVRARSDKQTAMDAKVKELHTAWVKAGKPSTWDGQSKVAATYFIQPNLAADLHKLVNRAAAYHGLRVRMGTPFKVSEKHVSRYGLPANYLGREAVTFAVLDKRPRTTPATKPADGPATQK